METLGQRIKDRIKHVYYGRSTMNKYTIAIIIGVAGGILLSKILEYLFWLGYNHFLIWRPWV